MLPEYEPVLWDDEHPLDALHDRMDRIAGMRSLLAKCEEEICWLMAEWHQSGIPIGAIAADAEMQKVQVRRRIDSVALHARDHNRPS